MTFERDIGMNKAFSVQCFSDARTYFSRPIEEGWSLVVVEFDENKPIYRDARLALRHSAIEFACSADAKAACPAMGKVDEDMKFFFLIAERFEGLGARSSFARRSAQLADESLGILRIVSKQTELRKDICYSVPANPTWIEKIPAANVAVGLVCFDEDRPNDDDLLWVIESLPENFVRNSRLIDTGMPDANSKLLVHRKLFSFSGEFDDPWSSLLIYAPACGMAEKLATDAIR